MALGATRGDVRRQVLVGTLRLATIGIAVGLAASLALGRVIGSLLVGTSPTDAATFGWTALILLAIAVRRWLLAGVARGSDRSDARAAIVRLQTSEFAVQLLASLLIN